MAYIKSMEGAHEISGKINEWIKKLVGQQKTMSAYWLYRVVQLK